MGEASTSLPERLTLASILAYCWEKLRISPTIFRRRRENPRWPRLPAHPTSLNSRFCIYFFIFFLTGTLSYSKLLIPLLLQFVNVCFDMRVLKPRHCCWSLFIQNVFIFWIIAQFGAMLSKLHCTALDPRQQTCKVDWMICEWQTDRQTCLRVELPWSHSAVHCEQTPRSCENCHFSILSLMFSWSKEAICYFQILSHTVFIHIVLAQASCHTHWRRKYSNPLHTSISVTRYLTNHLVVS